MGKEGTQKQDGYLDRVLLEFSEFTPVIECGALKSPENSGGDEASSNNFGILEMM
jgi:hypothetical protein